MRQALQNKNIFLYLFAVTAIVFTATFSFMPQTASAGKTCGYKHPDKSKDQSADVTIDFGCKGKGNPITDAAFAIIRFLSIGVGLIIVGSLTYAGIQYTMSRGDPKATAEAIGRIRSNIVAFVIFIFAFAILNYLIPQGFIGL